MLRRNTFSLVLMGRMGGPNVYYSGDVEEAEGL